MNVFAASLAHLFKLSAGLSAEERELARLLRHRFHHPYLLRRALTHRSALNYNEDEASANEQLEFLGDAVLGFVVVDSLCRWFPEKSEGDLSKIKSMLVSGESLQALARKLDLGRYIRMSDNEARNGGRGRDSILENTFEALVGALYLDGGMKPATDFIQRTVFASRDALFDHTRDQNYKSALLEYLQARGLPAPVYRVVIERGPDHAKNFEVEVVLDGKRLGIGTGHSKKAAQQQAARTAVQQLVTGGFADY